MHIVLREFDRLDAASRQEAITFLVRRYGQPAEHTPPASVQAEPPKKRQGRPFSDNTIRVLECLEQEGPGTPAVVTERTGIPNTKQLLKRLLEKGYVRLEARGFYHFVCYP